MILLPESERLIVDLSALSALAPASALVAPVENAGGLTVKKRPDGLIEIESRRDTVRIRSDTVCGHNMEEKEEVRENGRLWLTGGAVSLCFILLIIIFLRKIS
ncbi:MAG: hypothetical protein ACRCX4_05585 [Bacteroidales bacterium]